MSSFDLKASFKIDYAPAHLKKWRSKRTGLQLTLIDQLSPVVEGYFAVATEIEDDSGCPHTLEHLIFMGSKKYPYKGLLDTLGNLAFSTTNAWTATDQTVYTLSTAGWEGFKMLLPAYLDHLLNPLLTDEACYTEVYHVDGEAKEKGVVFSEMTANVNQSWYVASLEAQRSMYAPKSGYSSETGGLIESLRVLTNEKIRKYHLDNYRPDNLNIIIAGTVDEEELLKVMEEFDSELPSLPEVPSKRPFVDSPRDLPLTADIVKEVEFPDKDESSGQILVSWIGPEATNHLENIAIDILGTYMTDSSISLLEKNLIETEDPYAVETMYYTEDYINTAIYITLLSVPTEKLHEAKDKLFSLLKSGMEEFDIERVRQVLETSKSNYIFQTEKNPENISQIAISHFLYGKTDDSDLAEWSKDLNEYDTLANWTKEQWLEIWDKYLIQNKSCTILAKPSSKSYASKKKENKQLLEKRKLENDLDQLKKKLEDAMEYNDRPIPNETLSQFGQPDPSKVKFLNSTTVGAGLSDTKSDPESDVSKYVAADCPNDFPLYLHFENFESQFMSINIIASSFQIDAELLPYLRIFEDIFSLPVVLEDGTEVPYETVIAEIKKLTLSTSFQTSFNSSFEEVINISVKLPRENYSKVIEWIKRILFQTKFEKSRVRVSVEKEINGLSDLKRSGSSMLRSVTNRNIVTERSLKKATDSLFNEEFNKTLLKEIDDSDYSKIEANLEKIRSQLFESNNFRILICGDILKVPSPVSSWSDFAKTSSENKTESGLVPVPRTHTVLTETGSKLPGKAFLLVTPGSEASYIKAASKVPHDYLHEDIPKIALVSAYLEAVEGPFWRGIRGTGLAYGANVGRNLECGHLYFEIYRGADAGKCLEVGKTIVNEYADGAKKFEKLAVQGAISSVVNRIAESGSHNFLAAVDKFTDDILMQRGPNYNTISLEKLRDVTIDDLVYAIKKYYAPLFDSEKSCIFSCVHPSELESYKKVLKSLGYDISVEELSVDEDSEGEEYSDEEDEDSEDSSSEEESEDE